MGVSELKLAKEVDVYRNGVVIDGEPLPGVTVVGHTNSSIVEVRLSILVGGDVRVHDSNYGQ
jgi:hypothetical protein